MPSSKNLLIGLMSGTSLDGIDAVLTDFEHGQPRVLAARHQPLGTLLQAELLALCNTGDDEVQRLAQAEQRLTEAMALAVQKLLSEAGQEGAAIRAIGCHGQTVRHCPQADPPFTLQLCNPSLLAERTGITTIADFRRRDMAAGGQGAPLAPAFHRAAFAIPGQARLVLNIGGIANLTVIDQQGATTGFDTGPGNLLLDAWCQQHWSTTFDHGGEHARKGQVLPALLEKLRAHPFLALPAPKSTGREEFSFRWLQGCLEGQERAAPEDVQATLAEFTADSIAGAILAQDSGAVEVFLCGGGACNDDLAGRLERLLPGYKVASTAALGIGPRQVEAAAFAWLAWRTLQGQAGNLPAVTGAAGERILGGIYPA